MKGRIKFFLPVLCVLLELTLFACNRFGKKTEKPVPIVKNADLVSASDFTMTETSGNTFYLTVVGGSIFESVFSYCATLTESVISAEATAVRETAFISCSALTDVRHEGTMARGKIPLPCFAPDTLPLLPSYGRRGVSPLRSLVSEANGQGEIVFLRSHEQKNRAQRVIIRRSRYHSTEGRYHSNSCSQIIIRFAQMIIKSASEFDIYARRA